MFASTLIFAAAAMSPQVQACAAAVRADSHDASELCQPPKVDLFSSGDGELSAECVAALKAGQATRKVPDKLRWTMLRKFEDAMSACASPINAGEVPERKTVKLSD